MTPTTPEHDTRSVSSDDQPIVTSEKAVSYVIGFALIFSIAVVSTVGLFIFGFDVLSDVDQDQTVSLGEKNMDTIRADLADLTTQQAATREQRLQLANAQLGFGENSTIRVSAIGQTFNLIGTNSLEWETRSLVYRLPDRETEFVYAFGHVFRRYDDPNSQSLSTKAPLIDYSNNQMFLVVPTVTQHTESPDQISAGELTEREIVAEKPRPLTSSTTSIERTNRQPNGDPTNMSGTIAIEETTAPNAWHEALENLGLENVQTTPTGANEYEVTGDFEAEQLVIKQADIRFLFSSPDS
jgi:hypothetical protein